MLSEKERIMVLHEHTWRSGIELVFVVFLFMAELVLGWF